MFRLDHIGGDVEKEQVADPVVGFPIGEWKVGKGVRGLDFVDEGAGGGKGVQGEVERWEAEGEIGEELGVG